MTLTYFLVTSTLPAELYACFFGRYARMAYDLFFTAVLHTCNQQLGFHPPIHCLALGCLYDDDYFSRAGEE